MPGCQAAFSQAFPGQAVSLDTIAAAIATYERTVVSGEAPFDRWVKCDESAVSEPAKRAFVLFNGRANCAGCHAGWRMTDDGFHDIGLPGNDRGRAAVAPGIEQMEHAFKTPSLRNIAQRAPFMHDGSVASLSAVREVIGGLEGAVASIFGATDAQFASTRAIAERVSYISSSTASVAGNIREAQATAGMTEDLAGEVARAAGVMDEKAAQLSEQFAGFVLELRSSGRAAPTPADATAAFARTA